MMSSQKLGQVADGIYRRKGECFLRGRGQKDGAHGAASTPKNLKLAKEELHKRRSGLKLVEEDESDVTCGDVIRKIPVG